MRGGEKSHDMRYEDIVREKWELKFQAFLFTIAIIALHWCIDIQTNGHVFTFILVGCVVPMFIGIFNFRIFLYALQGRMVRRLILPLFAVSLGGLIIGYIFDFYDWLPYWLFYLGIFFFGLFALWEWARINNGITSYRLLFPDY